MTLIPNTLAPPVNGHAGGTTDRLASLLTSGGDGRIALDSFRCNKYYAGALPFAGLAYGSTTISSLSADAMEHLIAEWGDDLNAALSADAYAQALDEIRHRILALYATPDTDIVFAASGTDLEYVGLAVRVGRGPIWSILLGRDEVGSGCVQSTSGRFFASRTAPGNVVSPGDPIDPAYADTIMRDVAIREADGTARSSIAVTADLVALIDEALAAGGHPLVHVVHGSKTGLVLPSLADVGSLAGRYGDSITLLVDACQLRISPADARAYLATGAVVMMTGSKFAGGPPFSGFALVPKAIVDRAAPLPAGHRWLSARAEWPQHWPGADALPDGANFGLLLRMQAAMFEITRFAAIDHATCVKIITQFAAAVQALADDLGVTMADAPVGPGCPLATRSLATLDLAARWPDCDLDRAGAWHRFITLQWRTPGLPPVRLGQPVKVRRLADDRFAGSLRLALSMPMISELAALGEAGRAARLATDMTVIARAIRAAAATS